MFIQGGGAGTHDEWDDKLVASLNRELGLGYELLYPRMPNEEYPNYAKWKVALTQVISGLEDGVILIGHSIGGTILINAIADAPPERKLDGIFLIAAPFVGEGGWPSDEIKPTPSLGVRLPPEVPIYLYHGIGDDTVPVSHLELYERSIPRAIAQRLHGRNHQLNDNLAEVAVDIRALT